MNRNDRKVATAALAVGVLALVGLWLTSNDTVIPQPSRKADSTHYAPKTHLYYATPSTKAERFPFDPNTADSTQLLRLGLQPWQVRNIYKYRARGGIYRQKEDFARLYGLTVKQYRELEPYIHISNDYLPASTLVGDRTKSKTGPRRTIRHMNEIRYVFPSKSKKVNTLSLIMPTRHN